jgi:micrococcal nuclease
MNDYTYQCELDRVVDGDTMDLVVDLGFNISLKIRVRLGNFNAPEPRGETREEGLRYKKKAQLWFERNIREGLFVQTRKSGKFGRWIGDIFYRKSDISGSAVYLHSHLEEGGSG